MNFQKKLINWYSEHKRDLPWRHTKDPYFIWLSEIILQQTQVKQGLPYYKAFVEAYPSVFHLAEASEEHVLKNWQGLGYYSRARNLHATARYIASELQGVFPSNYKELIKLKGVGDYTASAIASFAYDAATAVLDGNVFRVLSRYYGIDTAINTTEGAKLFKELAQSLLLKDQPGIYNQAIMEFGALQCKPANPDCEVCPLANSCAALKDHRVGELPVKLKTTKVKKHYYNYLVLIDPEGHTIIEKRQEQGIWRNLYQFPLIESSKSLSHEAFSQELETHKHKLPAHTSCVLYNEQDIVHKLTHKHLYTKFWIFSLKARLKDGLPFKALKKYPMPTLMANFLKDFSFKKV
jgi:A/G-specific adenine glycosylase